MSDFLGDTADSHEPTVDDAVTVGERATELRRLLVAAGAGDATAFDGAFALLYEDLRRLARAVRAGRASETLSATALVHEAFFKLQRSVGSDEARQWTGRQPFLQVAARAMRQVLANAARDRQAAKRGGDALLVTLDPELGISGANADEIAALDEALERFGRLDPRAAQVVECRVFGGLTAEETAEALTVSVPTVQRDWRSARAWLRDQLADWAPSPAPGAP